MSGVGLSFCSPLNAFLIGFRVWQFPLFPCIQQVSSLVAGGLPEDAFGPRALNDPYLHRCADSLALRSCIPQALCKCRWKAEVSLCRSSLPRAPRESRTHAVNGGDLVGDSSLLVPEVGFSACDSRHLPSDFAALGCPPVDALWATHDSCSREVVASMWFSLLMRQSSGWSPCKSWSERCFTTFCGRTSRMRALCRGMGLFGSGLLGQVPCALCRLLHSPSSDEVSGK